MRFLTALRLAEWVALLAAAGGVIAGLLASSGKLLGSDASGTATVPLAILSFCTLAAAWAAVRLIADHRRRRRNPRRIFLIYSQDDQDRAREIAAFLREAGFEPWLDTEQLLPGQLWQKTVVQALEESAAAVALVSAHLNDSAWARHELARAFAALPPNRHDASAVVPIRLDDAPLPETLRHVQALDIHDKDWHRRLLDGLNYLLAPVAGPHAVIRTAPS